MPMDKARLPLHISFLLQIPPKAKAEPNARPSLSLIRNKGQRRFAVGMLRCGVYDRACDQSGVEQREIGVCKG
jgi:hypothetical protein